MGYLLLDVGESYDMFTVTAVTGHNKCQNKPQNVLGLKKYVLEIVKYKHACIYFIMHNHFDVRTGEKKNSADLKK